MRVLFLDDMHERHVAFDRKLGKHYDEVIHVMTYDQCIKALGSDRFDIVFLDHDLSYDSIMCNPHECDEMTGSDVAHWIVANLKAGVDAPKFVVHSLNPAGRRNIANVLNDAGFEATEIPFLQLMSR